MSGAGVGSLASLERYAAGMERQLSALGDARAEGMPRLGWKIGLNVPEVQARLGVAHGGVGWLDGRRRHASGDTVTIPPGARLHLEPEVALRLGADVPAGAGADEARAGIAAVAPALELVDYARPVGGPDPLAAVTGHAMFHAGCVLGAEAPPLPPDGLGTRWPELCVGARRSAPPRPGLVAEWGELVAFAAAFLGAFGEALRAGDWLLSGSYTEAALPLAAGDEAVARFGALGEVRLHARA